jgi:hypothetical protein
MASWLAAGPVWPGHHDMALGLDNSGMVGIEEDQAWVIASQALPGFHVFGCDAHGKADGGGACSCAQFLWWRLARAVVYAVSDAHDGVDGDAHMDFILLLTRWIPRLRIVMQVQYLHMQKELLVLYFFTQSEDALRNWHSGSEYQVHVHLRHLHQYFKEAPNLKRISTCGYANFILHHVYVEIFDSGYWTIVNAAKNLAYLNWDHLSSVDLWINVSIIVTFLQHDYVHTHGAQ